MKLLILLLAVSILAPVAFSNGIAAAPVVPKVVVGSFQLGDSLFSSYETFHFNMDKFQIKRGTSSIVGYVTNKMVSPIGDTIIANYSITYFKHPFTETFPSSNGYYKENFPGDKAYEGDLGIFGKTSFTYLTVNFALEWPGNITINQIPFSQHYESSGAPIYNISLNSTSSRYSYYLPGTVVVNDNSVDTHLRFYKMDSYLLIRISFPISDGEYSLNIPSALTASSGISQYLSSTTNISGPFASLTDMISDNLLSIAIGGMLFFVIILAIYAGYRKK